MHTAHKCFLLVIGAPSCNHDVLDLEVIQDDDISHHSFYYVWFLHKHILKFLKLLPLCFRDEYDHKHHANNVEGSNTPQSYPWSDEMLDLEEKTCEERRTAPS